MKKETEIIIVGVGGAGSSEALDIAEKLATQGKVVIVENLSKIQATISNKPEPIPFRNFRKIEPLAETEIKFVDFEQVSNPFPSPKGRRGKRKW